METIVKAISNEFMCRARQWRDVADFEQSGINYPLSLVLCMPNESYFDDDLGVIYFWVDPFLVMPNRPDCNPSLNFRRALLDNQCIENILANFLNGVNSH